MEAAPESQRSTWRVALPYVVLLACVVLIPSSGHDDKYATFWAADHLAQTGRLVNFNGDRVEQSSTLLEVLALAALRACTRLPIDALALALSIGGGLLSIALAGRLAKMLAPGAAEPARWLTALFPPLVLWSFSAMETTLATALYLAALVTLHRYTAGDRGPMALVWALGAAVLVRPEAGVVWCTALVLALVASYRDQPRQRRLLVALATTVALAGLLACGRHLYFGRWVPQPVIAKSTGYFDLSGSVRALFRPDMAALGAPLFTLLAGIAGVRALGRREPAATLLGALMLALLAFVLTAGEDVLLGARWLVPVGPLLAAWAAVELSTFAAKTLTPARRRAARGVLAVALVAQAICVVQYARKRSPAIPLFVTYEYADPNVRAAVARGTWLERHNRPHARDLALLPRVRAAVDEVLARREHVVLASEQAGFITARLAGELFGRLRFVDRLGLATRDWESCREEWQGCGPIADVEFGFRGAMPGMSTLAREPLEHRVSNNWVFMMPREFPAQEVSVRR